MKQLVTYLSLFGGGCIVGVFATKKYFERKYRDISEAEIESVKEVYRRKKETLKDAKKEESIEIGKSADDKQIGSIIFKNMTPENMQSMAFKYHTISNDIPDEHPIEEDYKPYMIDVDTFDETSDGYSKHEYSYYMDDSTLVSIEDEIVSAADTIGVDNLEVFENSDEEVCYIRNESSGADYEVTKVFSSYSAIVGDDY